MSKQLVVLALALQLVACNQKRSRPAKSTATQSTVTAPLVEVSLPIKALSRERNIRIYLPPGYDTSEERYPVLYMLDGQNLFDDRTAYAGEWKVDETLNAMAAEGELSLIVVGIDNELSHRMTEYSPWDHPKHGPQEGEAFMAFVVNTVKPYIDERYRTLPGRENTGIMGSSMGAFISHYAILRYPDVFSKVGILSPSYWYSDHAYALLENAELTDSPRIYMTVGDSEGRQMVSGAKRMAALFRKRGLTESTFFFDVASQQQHNGAFWASRFPGAVRWLYINSKIP